MVVMFLRYLNAILGIRKPKIINIFVKENIFFS